MRQIRQAAAILPARWSGYAAALLAVALVSLVIWLLLGSTHLANISMLYLIAVLATAVVFGRGPAILASVAAFVTFDVLFVQPYYTLRVADPEEWIALLLFLATALITGQLAADQRQRAAEASQREREAVVLYDVARVLSEPNLDQALDAIAAVLRAELQLEVAAIVIEDGGQFGVGRAAAGDPEALRLASAATVRPARLLHEGPAPTALRRGDPGRWVGIVPPRPPGTVRSAASERLYLIPVKMEGGRVGTIVLVRAPERPRFTAADDRLLSAVATQLAQALERIRLRREATEAEILRRTDELKTALLNAVSHDLRTPLATILAAAGSLLQKDVSWTEEDRGEFAAAIRDEAQRLNRIVGNLLDLSRIEAGSLRPEKGWYDLRALVDDVLGRLRPVTVARQVTIDIPDDLPPVLLDYVQIDQVLSNLVENAVRYTPEGTGIELSARRADGVVSVAVADRGPGIPAAALPHLFAPFYRVEDTGAERARQGGRGRSRGTGLGLAVAKGLVEAHGGRIWVENRREGGAIFIFTLPLVAPAEAMKTDET